MKRNTIIHFTINTYDIGRLDKVFPKFKLTCDNKEIMEQAKQKVEQMIAGQ
jgi:hypothetical protein